MLPSPPWVSAAGHSRRAAELEEVVGLRLKSREGLTGLLQAAFQANESTQWLFAPWFQIMEMQISRSLEEARKGDAAPGAQDARDLAAWIVLDRSAQRGFAAVLDQLVQTATVGEKPRLPVVEFQLRRGLDDLGAKAKDLDSKLRPCSSSSWTACARSPSGLKGCSPSVARSSI